MVEPLPVLMYHALYRDERELAAIAEADRPYALSLSLFEAHLHALKRAGFTCVLRPSEGSSVSKPILLTFDDGHSSAVHLAMPALHAAGAKGLFFITTGFAGRDPAFCTHEQWLQLQQGGMRLGSHGVSHRFLADLSVAECRQELHDSAAALRQVLGQTLDSLSYPGGRGGQRESSLAGEIGLTELHGSTFGVNSKAVAPGGSLQRIPIRRDMSAATVLQLVDRHSALHRRVALTSWIKGRAKHWLGNERYDAIYRRFA